MNYFRNDIKLVIIFVIIGFLIGPKIFANQKEKISSVKLDNLNSEIIASTTQENIIDAFSDVKINAASAYVYDIADKKVLYSKDGDTKRPLASITKMMTAVVALETKKESDVVKVEEEDLETEGDSGLSANESWSLDKLLALTLVDSSNDGASAIAASVGSSYNPNLSSRSDEVSVFVKKMNEKSKELELNSFYFTTPTGLDIGNTPGGVGSAHDVAKLFDYVLRRHSNLLQYTALPEISVSSKNKIVHRVVNTNEIASMTPGIIGGKTGYTDLAGGNLAVVVDVGIQHPVAIVVLGSTKEKRFSDVQKLIEKTKIAIIN